jgi:hypothetical protein
VRTWLSLTLLALVGTLGLWASQHTGRAAVVSHGCGHARWDVKTLSDDLAKDVVRTAVPATVDDLVAKPEPAKVPNSLPRQHGFDEVEFTTYRVKVHLDGWKISPDDQDIHLVVLDPDSRESMIVELPNAACIPTKTRKSDRTRMEKARAAIEKACTSVKLSSTFRRLLGTATITGVGFFDRKHKQIGLADNGIELHPVLTFRSSNCRGG